MAEPKKPRGRKGGRIPLSSEEKRVLAYFYLPRWLLKAFKELIPIAADRSNLVVGWVRTYTNTGGKTDCLLSQSSLAAELLAYLEATDAPEQLQIRLKSLIVQQASDEDRLATRVAKTKDGAHIV